MSITGNVTKAAQTTLVQTRGLHKPPRLAILSQLVEATTLDNGLQLSTFGGSTNSSPSTCQDYYPGHQTNSFDMGQSPSTLDNLFLPPADLELGGLMYCPGPTKYMWHPTWHSKTRVNPPLQPCNKSTSQAPQLTGYL